MNFRLISSQFFLDDNWVQTNLEYFTPAHTLCDYYILTRYVVVLFPLKGLELLEKFPFIRTVDIDQFTSPELKMFISLFFFSWTYWSVYLSWFEDLKKFICFSWRF